MNTIISNGDYTARVQLPAERRQLAGALSYLDADHASAYDIKYNEESDKGLSFTLIHKLCKRQAPICRVLNRECLQLKENKERDHQHRKQYCDA